jgi:hypothetical protein
MSKQKSHVDAIVNAVKAEWDKHKLGEGSHFRKSVPNSSDICWKQGSTKPTSEPAMSPFMNIKIVMPAKSFASKACEKMITDTFMTFWKVGQNAYEEQYKTKVSENDDTVVKRVSFAFDFSSLKLIFIFSPTNRWSLHGNSQDTSELENLILKATSIDGKAFPLDRKLKNLENPKRKIGEALKNASGDG